MEEPNYEQLRNLVARGELGLVIEQLTTAGVVPAGYRNAVLALSARYRELKQELIAGTQPAEATTLTKNRLNRATLGLLDAMESGAPWELDETDTDSSATTIQGKNIVGGNVSNIGGDFRIGDNQGE